MYVFGRGLRRDQVRERGNHRYKVVLRTVPTLLDILIVLLSSRTQNSSGRRIGAHLEQRSARRSVHARLVVLEQARRPLALRNIRVCRGVHRIDSLLGRTLESVFVAHLLVSSLAGILFITLSIGRTAPLLSSLHSSPLVPLIKPSLVAVSVSSSSGGGRWHECIPLPLFRQFRSNLGRRLADNCMRMTGREPRDLISFRTPVVVSAHSGFVHLSPSLRQRVLVQHALPTVLILLGESRLWRAILPMIEAVVHADMKLVVLVRASGCPCREILLVIILILISSIVVRKYFLLFLNDAPLLEACRKSRW
ncbi:hypothetical protein PFISCL1PPCAC_4366 [Pristionchus fissidentatus]|uniref:G protein-coupled receptor n=1 Tax=Pristionchus fissidentatus TaxID=1538716 RepID=A0AAV5V116_9BILA|nr:hypothetical protein PFISCL1PPCAC_4366 [Pristionchus fissidentatus]